MAAADYPDMLELVEQGLLRPERLVQRIPARAGILTPGGLCNPLQESEHPYK
jgi:hypothetical protein